MVGRDDRQRPDLSSWKVQLLRLTIFTETDLSVNGDRWWNDLVGSEAENKASRQKGAERQWDSGYEGGRLILQTKPGRIDWLFIKTEEEGSGDEKSDSTSSCPLESFPSALDVFTSLMDRHIVQYDDCKRLAFGAILQLPVNGREEGYQQISKYVGFNIDGTSASDFLFQINRPRASKASGPDLQINRLSKWSVVLTETRWLVISPEGTLPMGSVSSSAACQLELDINTPFETSIRLTRQLLPKLFHELVDFGKEIAEKGSEP